MTTQKEQMILGALVEHTQTHRTFRNRHLSQLSGLARQDVNYYLRKWEERGYIRRNPFEPAEYITEDLGDLLAGMITSVSSEKATHAKNVAPFDEDRLNNLTRLSDLYVALKSIGVPVSQLENLRGFLTEAIDTAIQNLRNERSYLHTKTMGRKRAVGLVDNWHYGDYSHLVREDVVDLFVEQQKKTLKLLEDQKDD